MHFESEQNSSPPLTEELRQLHDESRERLKSLDDEQSDDSSVCEEEADDYSEDEIEFQRIRDMEERYLLQNSAKTKPTTGSGDKPATGQKTSQSLESKKTQKEAENEIVDEKESKETEMETKESDIDPIPELIEKVMEQFTPKPQVPPQIQTDFMEIVQNSLKSFQNDALANEQVDTITTDDLPTPLMADESIRMTFSFEPNHILNPENIAKAFFDAMSSTNITFASGHPENLSKTEAPEEKLDGKPPPISGSNSNLNAQQNASIDEPNDDDKYEDLEHGDKEVELEHIGNASPSPVQPDEHNYDDADDYDNESYYDTQFEYQITSKTPSCFNSEDYVFHANFIRPTPTTDKLR